MGIKQRATALPGPIRRAALWKGLAWLLLAADLALLGGMVALQAAGCGALVDGLVNDPSGAFSQIFLSLTSLAFAVLGVMIVAFRPGNRIGWLSLVTGLSILVMGFPLEYAACGFSGLHALPGWPVMGWLSNMTMILPLFLIFVMIPLWFPDGQYLSPGWRRLATGFLLALGVMELLSAFWPGALTILEAVDAGAYPNPFALDFTPPPLLDRLLRTTPNLLVVAAGLAANTSLVVRWRRSTGETRQQIKWLAFFLVTAVSLLLTVEAAGALFYPSVFDTWFYLLVLSVGWVGFPVIIGVAVLKYRLYSIDFIIRRTLIYFLLTGSVALIYSGSVILLRGLLESLTGSRSESPLVIVVSTLAIAALFNPLRRRIQDTVDRRFYRRRYDSGHTLTAFAAEVSSEVDANQLAGSLLRVVDETVQPEQASVWLRRS